MIILKNYFGNKNLRIFSYHGIALILILLVTCCPNLFAQTESDSLQQLRFDSLARIPLLIYRFQADLVEARIQVDSNSSLLRQNEFNEINLNNFNSPQLHLSNYRHSDKLYDHGINSMNFSMTGFDNYSFISPNKPYAEIATHRGRAFSNSQATFSDNIDIHLIFAENFRNKLLWNFSYDKDNFKGIYANSRQKNSLFTTGVQYTGKTDKFHLNVLYLDERHTIENNWGISSDTIFNNPNYDIRESVPVNNTIALTTSYDRSIGVNTDFPINIHSDIFHPVVYFKTFYTDYSYRYTDSGIDSIKQSTQPFHIDSSNLNNLLTQKIWTHSAGIRLFANSKMETKIGFRYEYQSYDHDTFPLNRNVYQFEASGKYNINTNFDLNAKLALKHFQESLSPDLRIGLNIGNQTNIYGQINAFITSDPIPYIYRKLIINKKFFWQNDFQNNFIRETGISFTLNTEKWIHSSIHVSWSELSNFIFLNSFSFPISQDGIQKLNIGINLPIRFKWITLNSQFNYHSLNPDPSHFTGWNSNHQLSFNRSLFKKVVNAELGASLKLYDYKYKYNFNPVIQLFYPSDLPNKMIYSLGVFMHFKVSDFQLLLDLDNIDSFWIKNRPSLVEKYPFYDFYLNFGLQWTFLN